MKLYQQGDVLLKKVEKVPAGAVRRKAICGRYVIAEGESTGHAHAIAECEAVEMFERNGTLYLRVGETVPMTHEQHLPQTVEPGVYEVGIVRELDPFTEEVRSVQD
jgi:hypothetical protein